MRAFLVLSALVILGVAFAAPADAAWHGSGSGTGAATTSTLAAPTGVTVAAISLPTVSVSWTASGAPTTPTGYYVTRKTGSTTTAACASSATTLLTTTSCVDTSVPAATYTYAVIAVYRSWDATSLPSGSVTVWAPSKVVFTTQPTNTVAGVSITPAVAVTVENAAGTAVPIAGISVSLAIGTNPGSGTLSGTATASTNSSGVATLAGLSINKSGVGYTLTAASTGLTTGTSSAFTISAAAPVRVVFGQQPTNTTQGQTITPAVTAVIVDSFGNQTTSIATVSIAIGTNPSLLGAASLSGTLSKAAVAGLATFSNLSIAALLGLGAGNGFTLVITCAGLANPTATSNPFNIT